MVDVNSLLSDVVQDMKDMGFPVSENLKMEIEIDYDTYYRVGACYRYKFPEKYIIHLSEDVLHGNVEQIKNILAHEVLHTHFLTMDHNILWNHFKDRINQNSSYNIKEKYSWFDILNIKRR